MPTNTSYIPRATLFQQPEVMAIKISPDSKYLAYVKSDPSGTMNLYLSLTDKSHNNPLLKQLTFFTTPEIYRFYWTDDSKHIIFLKDENGSKCYQLYSLNIESGQLENPTKNFKNSSIKIFKIHDHRIAVGINDRNPQFHDIYIFDAKNNSLTKSLENDQYFHFFFDNNFEIILKNEIQEDGSINIYKDDNIYLHFSSEDAFHSTILKIIDSTIYYLDSRNSNTTQFKSLNMVTNKETILAHDEKSDINEVIFSATHPLIYSTTWLNKEWHCLGSANIDFLIEKLGKNFDIVNQNKNFWIIRSYSPQQIGSSFYLYHIDSQIIIPLFIAATHPQLAHVIPLEFKSRDNLLLTGYITLPHQIKSLAEIKDPLPLIVFPHGGPFKVRDNMTYHPYAQWLASRGYAVLMVNFRLSSGLGKNLVTAGNGEWGRKALFDLIDGLNWCIDKGITTSSRVGIMGISYGGYATLSALTFTPKEFLVGISVVGPSSLVTVMQRVPKYWDFPSYPLSDSELFFTKNAFLRSMGGNPDTPEGKKFLESRSPLNFCTQIERPLLLIQGDNDPIVTKLESEQMFNGLKKLKKPVGFITFSDEGHQFRRYANMDVYLAYAEKLLHDTLGGDYEPIDLSLKKESSATIHEINLAKNKDEQVSLSKIT